MEILQPDGLEIVKLRVSAFRQDLFEDFQHYPGYNRLILLPLLQLSQSDYLLGGLFVPERNNRWLIVRYVVTLSLSPNDTSCLVAVRFFSLCGGGSWAFRISLLT